MSIKIFAAVMAVMAIVSGATAQATLYDALKATKSLSLLKAAIDTVPEFVAATQDPNAAFTVFAPTNKGVTKTLEKLGVTPEIFLGNQALVKAVLAYHIVPAVALSTQLSNGQKLPTLGGDAFGQLTVVLKKNGKVVIRGAGSKATVKTADVKVGASVVHIVGNVILPDLTKLA